MKKIYSVLFLAFLSFHLKAQIKAITDNGEEVLLNSDGTWKYASITPAFDTRLDTVSYTKLKESTFKVKSEKIDIGVWIDPKKWKFEKSKDDDTKEYEYFFSLKGQDAYVMMITERIPVPYESLSEIALNNLKKVATDATLVREEWRKINGVLVKMLQMEGTMKGIKFVYFGYYFFNENGTMQLVGLTAQSLFRKYKTDIEDLLNGFTLTN